MTNATIIHIQNAPPSKQRFHKTPFENFKFKPRACKNCGEEFKPNSGSHRYCDDCRLVVSQWIKKSAKSRRKPKDPVKSAYYTSINRARMLDVSRKANAAERESACVDMSTSPSLAWVVRVSVPFTYAASKNSRHGYGAKKVWTNKDSRQFRDSLALAMRAALRGSGTPVVNGKLWVEIFVQKPDHRGDAVNVIDVVCDAIQDATGLNDRWYSLKRVDWQVVKNNPMLIVGVGQEHTEPRDLCSYCGLEKPATDFVTSGAKRSKARLCASCRKPKWST